MRYIVARAAQRYIIAGAAEREQSAPSTVLVEPLRFEISDVKMMQS